jgi:hypothetical protein
MSNPYGLMDRAEYDRMCNSIRRSAASPYSKRQQLEAARLLLDDGDGRVRASAPARQAVYTDVAAAAPEDGELDDELDEDLSYLFRPQPGRERQWRTARLAADAAARAAAVPPPVDDDADEEYNLLTAALWPPATPVEVRHQAEARAMLAASAPAGEDELTDEEWERLFPPESRS